MNNPHDQLFKKVMSQRSEARRLLQHFVSPAIRETVDLDSLTIQSGSLLDDYLKEYFTDVVYRCKIQGNKDAKLCFLFEHKSYPDAFLLLQVLYYMAATYRKQMEEGQMELVIPVVFTHGRYDWKIVQMSTIFDLPSAAFAEYLPTYKYELIRVHHLTEADLEPIRSSYLLSMMLAFQARGSTRLLLTHIREMFTFVEQTRNKSLHRSFVTALATYLVSYFKLKDSDMMVIRKALPTVVKETFFSTADRLRAEGKTEGRKLERKISAIDKNIETTVNILIEFPTMDDKTIAKIVNVDLDFIYAVRRTFTQRLIKQRREHFYKFYADVKNFVDNHQQQATELFEKLRKKIRKSKTKIAPPPKPKS